MPPVTARVPGTNTTTISYTIPGAGLDVETVRVGIDASLAGSAVTATVTITDQSGVVIATKPQNATIPSGATGSATWALRLDDDATGSGTGTGIAFDTFPQAGNWLYVETDNEAGSPHGYGTQLIDTSAGGMQVEAASASLALGQEVGLGVAALLLANGGIQLDNRATGEVNIFQTSADGITIEDRYLLGGGSGIHIRSDKNDVVITAQGSIILSPTGVLVAVLPIVDPGISGALWNNGGVVNVSP